MIQISNCELKNIELSLLKQIHSFCVDNNLRYFLCGGTLLGAIRHKGFIPWDDDIDIQMPRPDYDYLIKNFVSNEDICLLSPGRKDYYYNFTKAVNPKTIVVENNYKPISGCGVFIDIFPLDGMPDDEINRKKHFERLDSIRNRINSFGLQKPKLRFNLFMFCKQCFNYIYAIKKDVNVYQNEYVNIAKQYDYEKSRYVYLSGGAYHYKEIYEKTIYNGKTLVEFEGEHFFAPVQWDRYLTETYGDYMQLPPADRQVSNHSFNAYYIS